MTTPIQLLRSRVGHGAPVAIAAACALAVCVSASAQVTNLAAASPSAPVTGNGPVPTPPENQREAEYAALAHDVQMLDREFSLVKRVVRLVTPTVVHIESKPLPKYQGLLHVEEAGSGVIVQFGDKFYVLTNRHVVRHSLPEKQDKLQPRSALDRVEIHFADGRVIHPSQVWTDSETDVAVLAIDADNLAPARLGNSDSLEIGDFVLAVGSPFGLSQSVTRGIVSAKGRHNLDLGDEDLKWQNFIQTDAAINPGNSGGPLVNLRGEVVGINTAIASASGGNEGIGFSIPINIVNRTATALVTGKEPPRGFLGVDLDDQFTERRATELGLAHLFGTRVIATHANSPALRAGLQVNDVIVRFNGTTVDNDAHLKGLIKLSEIGQQINLLIFRDGKPLDKVVEIGNLSDYKRD